MLSRLGSGAGTFSSRAFFEPADESLTRERRQCPGIFVADSNVFVAISSLLATFTISKTQENGVPATPAIEQTSGAIRSVVGLLGKLLAYLHAL